jgi:hypothetical protein
MNQPQNRTIRYALAGFCGLALLLIIAWPALRESPPPSPDLPPVKAVTVSPHAAPFTPNNDAPPETPTNAVAQLATIPTNAATIYQQAFALYDALSKEQKYIVGDWRTNVDPSVTAELCEKIQPICDLVHQAAAATNCDWGLEPIIYTSLLPYLNPCRSLARATVWSAAHCRTDDPSATVDDLVAASRLGQNVALTPVVIGHLVNLSIQQTVIDAATMQASSLAVDPRLVQLLSGFNYNEELRRAIVQEADISDRTADAIPTMPPEEMMQMVNAFHSTDPSVQFPPMEPTQVSAYLRQIADLQRQYAQTLELPEADYRQWLNSLDQIRKTNPFVGEFLSHIEANVTKTQAMTVYNAMAVAGLVVVQQGTDALPSRPDPTTGQAFTYNRTADGFELESTFQFKGKSMTLSFH